MMNASVLVTGASGFVGGAVVRELMGRGLDVTGLARSVPGDHGIGEVEGTPRLGWIRGDIRDYEDVAAAVAECRPDVVINCAAAGTTQPDLDHRHALDVNLYGTINLMAAAAATEVKRFIQLGSCAEYGDRSDPISEDAAPAPRTAYAVAKAAATMAVPAGVGLPAGSCMEACVLRVFNTFGPGEDPRRLVPTIMRAVTTRVPCELSSGEQVRDFTYVADIARSIAHVACADKFPGGLILNLGSGTGTTVRDFAQRVVDLLGGDAGLLRFGGHGSASDAKACQVADIRRWMEFYGRPIAVTRLDDAIAEILGTGMVPTGMVPTRVAT